MFMFNLIRFTKLPLARSDESIVPELTKTFFENLLRKCDDSPKLHVTKVKVGTRGV